MYTWMQLNSPADLQQLTSYIGADYDPSGAAKKLSAALSPAVKAVLIEHNYIDKDYRSTYYNFYAKKGQRYKLDCVRLHFFDEIVTFENSAFRLRTADVTDQLLDHYYGFVI